MPPATWDHPATVCAAVWRRLPEIYLLCGLWIALLLTVLTPPFFVPDESHHAFRAIQVSHGQWLAQTSPQGVGTQVDTGVIAAFSRMMEIEGEIEVRYPRARYRPDARVNPMDLGPVQSIRWTHHDAFATFPNTAVYPPFFYLPAALGWRLGEAANLTIVHSLLLARALSTLGAIALGWLALRLCHSGRLLLFAALLLPTALNLNASDSQDAFALTVTALVMAVLSRALTAERPLTMVELVLTTALLTTSIAARLPYLPLAIVLLLPALNTKKATPNTKGTDTLNPSDLRQSVLAVLALLALVAVWQILVHPLGNYIGDGAKPADQVAFLRAHPLLGTAHVALGTIKLAPVLAITGLEILGENDAYAPRPVYVALTLSCLAFLLTTPVKCLRGWRPRVLLSLALASVIAGISLAEYIIWTLPGAVAVNGLQARYYLPLLPFAVFLLPEQVGIRSRLWLSERTVQVLSGFGLALFVLAILYTPWVAARRFYGLDLLSAVRLTTR